MSSHDRSPFRALRHRMAGQAVPVAGILFTVLALLALTVLPANAAALAGQKSGSSQDVMGDRARMRAVMADYLRFQQEVRDWARYEGIDVSFGPIKIDIGSRNAGGPSASDAPAALAAGRSCTVTLPGIITGLPTSVRVTAATCAEAYAAAKRGWRKDPE